MATAPVTYPQIMGHGPRSALVWPQILDGAQSPRAAGLEAGHGGARAQTEKEPARTGAPSCQCDAQMWIKKDPLYPKLQFVPCRPFRDLVAKTARPSFLEVSAELARERYQNPAGNPKLGYYGISWDIMGYDGILWDIIGYHLVIAKKHK